MTTDPNAPDAALLWAREQIAASLTKAQRKLLAIVCDEGRAIGCCDTRFDRFNDDTWTASFEAGLIYQIGSGDFDDHRIVPLPLGLAVRAILKGQTDESHP